MLEFTSAFTGTAAGILVDYSILDTRGSIVLVLNTRPEDYLRAYTGERLCVLDVDSDWNRIGRGWVGH